MHPLKKLQLAKCCQELTCLPAGEEKDMYGSICVRLKGCREGELFDIMKWKLDKLFFSYFQITASILMLEKSNYANSIQKEMATRLIHCKQLTTPAWHLHDSKWRTGHIVRMCKEHAKS